MSDACITSFRENASPISLNGDCAVCKNIAEATESTRNALRKYMLFPGLSTEMPVWQPAVIPTNEIADFAKWESRIKKEFDRVQYKRKATKLGYYTKPFNWKMFIPDIHDVNTSKEVRSGGVMRGSYLREIEDMGGAPTKLLEFRAPACKLHWTIPFGVFKKVEGHKQGDVTVNEKLVGYINLKRSGDIALYSMILGHGDHLRDGIMVLLHHDVVRWASENADGYATGLKYLMYGAVTSGGASLEQWKRWAGFVPRELDGYLTEAPPRP